MRENIYGMEYTANRVLSNKALPDNFFLMEVDRTSPVRMGQFYMLRAWENHPVLSRPISVFDSGSGGLSFLYKVCGQGTGIFAGLRAGDRIDLLGPLGNGFPNTAGKTALVGGGAGIAPLYLGAKQIREAHPDCRVETFLGFSGESFLVREFQNIAGQVIVNTGGFITDDINPADYDCIFSCGPEIMMKVLFEKCKKTGAEAKLYVSLENRMACGVGACFVCSRLAAGGNKKVCKDGPVFPAEEVFGL